MNETLPKILLGKDTRTYVNETKAGMSTLLLGLAHSVPGDVHHFPRFQSYAEELFFSIMEAYKPQCLTDSVERRHFSSYTDLPQE